VLLGHGGVTVARPSVQVVAEGVDGWLVAVLCRVHVPYVLEDMVSPRVLTMEFIDGVQVTDRDGLQVGCRLLGKCQQLHSAWRGYITRSHPSTLQHSTY
jgi:hypothetical protein